MSVETITSERKGLSSKFGADHVKKYASRCEYCDSTIKWGLERCASCGASYPELIPIAVGHKGDLRDLVKREAA